MAVSESRVVQLTCDVCGKEESLASPLDGDLSRCHLPRNWAWVAMSPGIEPAAPKPKEWLLACCVTCRCRLVDPGKLGEEQ